MAEQDDELWDTGRVAAYLGVQPVTVSAYLHRQQMPAPDYPFGQSPVWKASKIKPGTSLGQVVGPSQIGREGSFIVRKPSSLRSNFGYTTGHSWRVLTKIK